MLGTLPALAPLREPPCSREPVVAWLCIDALRVEALPRRDVDARRPVRGGRRLDADAIEALLAVLPRLARRLGAALGFRLPVDATLARLAMLARRAFGVGDAGPPRPLATLASCWREGAGDVLGGDPANRRKSSPSTEWFSPAKLILRHRFLTLPSRNSFQSPLSNAWMHMLTFTPLGLGSDENLFHNTSWEILHPHTVFEVSTDLPASKPLGLLYARGACVAQILANTYAHTSFNWNGKRT